MRVTYDQLREVREAMGAPWFTAPWDLNMIIARTNHVGEWDDRIFVACVDDNGREVVESFVCTGDAWEGEWLDPTHSGGCAYVLDQHVVGGLRRGTHKGRDALVQAKPFYFVRWDPETGRVPTVRELEALALEPGRKLYDVRGFNVHDRYNGQAPDKPAKDDSEGCTVQLYKHRHTMLMGMMDLQLEFRGASSVSPTYVRKSIFRR